MTQSIPEQIAAVLEGRARWAVVCGDCLEILPTLPERCCVVVTDVPYGAGKAYEGDKLPWEEWLPWVDARLAQCIRVGRLAFSFFGNTKLVRFIRETTVPPEFVINWHKPMMLHGRTLNGTPFLSHSEVILYWGPRSVKEAGKLGYDSVACNAMWPFERRLEGVEHPTPKPVKLIANSLKYWTQPEDIVIDPFCGSGSHLVAAIRTGRRCIGIDIDQRWVDESRRRILEELECTTFRARTDGQGALFGGET